MLICIAEGVDRFNGDPEALLKEAARRVEARSLMVPGPRGRLLTEAAPEGRDRAQ